MHIYILWSNGFYYCNRNKNGKSGLFFGLNVSLSHLYKASKEKYYFLILLFLGSNPSLPSTPSGSDATPVAPSVKSEVFVTPLSSSGACADYINYSLSCFKVHPVRWIGMYLRIIK